MRASARALATSDATSAASTQGLMSGQELVALRTSSMMLLASCTAWGRADASDTRAKMGSPIFCSCLSREGGGGGGGGGRGARGPGSAHGDGESRDGSRLRGRACSALPSCESPPHTAAAAAVATLTGSRPRRRCRRRRTASPRCRSVELGTLHAARTWSPPPRPHWIQSTCAEKVRSRVQWQLRAPPLPTTLAPCWQSVAPPPPPPHALSRVEMM